MFTIREDGKNGMEFPRFVRQGLLSVHAARDAA